MAGVVIHAEAPDCRCLVIVNGDMAFLLRADPACLLHGDGDDCADEQVS